MMDFYFRRSAAVVTRAETRREVKIATRNIVTGTRTDTGTGTRRTDIETGTINTGIETINIEIETGRGRGRVDISLAALG